MSREHFSHHDFSYQYGSMIREYTAPYGIDSNVLASALLDFLKYREIDDQFAQFLHEWMVRFEPPMDYCMCDGMHEAFENDNECIIDISEEGEEK